MGRFANVPSSKELVGPLQNIEDLATRRESRGSREAKDSCYPSQWRRKKRETTTVRIALIAVLLFTNRLKQDRGSVLAIYRGLNRKPLGVKLKS